MPWAYIAKNTVQSEVYDCITNPQMWLRCGYKDGPNLSFPLKGTVPLNRDGFENAHWTFPLMSFARGHLEGWSWAEYGDFMCQLLTSYANDVRYSPFG